MFCRIGVLVRTVSCRSLVISVLIDLFFRLLFIIFAVEGIAFSGNYSLFVLWTQFYFRIRTKLREAEFSFLPALIWTKPICLELPLNNFNWNLTNCSQHFITLLYFATVMFLTCLLFYFYLLSCKAPRLAFCCNVLYK